ncbi:MAG: hypothetical protein CFE25_00485 [Chitinophagaceae bacterium BSSC1]|nr:MAG: hypothetical protein CFE25_00485 [Chitinophagaceae bacterium BSSC1]
MPPKQPWAILGHGVKLATAYHAQRGIPVEHSRAISVGSVKGNLNAAIATAGGCKWRRDVLMAHP